MRSRSIPFAMLVLFAANSWADDEFFESRVRPLLIKSCYECHQRQAEGGLRLDSRQAILRGGNSGPAMVPGDAARSLLVQAIRREHVEIAMPPETPLNAEQVAIITQWIQDGAVWPDEVGAREAGPDDHGITESERAFWAFQPIGGPAPPVIEGRWGEHPIDAFVAQKHQQIGVTAGAEASSRTLLRRLSFDLTGLPPSLVELDRFEQHSRDDPQAALRRAVDRLLDSPQYGERWAQHWLDLVRYSDTAGDAADFPIPEAYKYRNYVIDAFQNDMPYDQFVREQLAGDLLPTDDEQLRWQRQIATGYLALSRRVGVVTLDHVVIEDTLNNLGKTFLGLTIGCARCHDHKFDPIPTSDYYALYGIFQSSVYPHAGAEHRPHRADFVYRIGDALADQQLATYQEPLAQLRERERAAFERYRDLQRKPESELGYTREEAWRDVLAIREEIRQFAESYPDLETAFAIREGEPEDAYVQQQGDPRERGLRVRRGFLQILGGQVLPENSDASGRLELAQWIASPQNPLTARVIANRVWHYHLGRGLVATTSDFGTRGQAPSHPELLDYLASYLIDHNWSIKSLHRLILTSRTWQLASGDAQRNAERDPQNVYLWRGNRRRLDAEQLRDSVLLVSGQLDTTRGQRHPFPHHLTYFFRQHEPFVGNFDSQRRSVYLFRQRIRKNDYLDLFDGPDGNRHLDARRPTTTSLQGLYLLNSEFMTAQAGVLADRVASDNGPRAAKVAWAYENLLGRRASAEELQLVTQQLGAIEADERNRDGSSLAEATKRAWATVLHAMSCSNEFLYID